MTAISALKKALKDSTPFNVWGATESHHQAKGHVQVLLYTVFIREWDCVKHPDSSLILDTLHTIPIFPWWERPEISLPQEGEVVSKSGRFWNTYYPGFLETANSYFIIALFFMEHTARVRHSLRITNTASILGEMECIWLEDGIYKRNLSYEIFFTYLGLWSTLNDFSAIFAVVEVRRKLFNQQKWIPFYLLPKKPIWINHRKTSSSVAPWQNIFIEWQLCAKLELETPLPSS